MRPIWLRRLNLVPSPDITVVGKEDDSFIFRSSRAEGQG